MLSSLVFFSWAHWVVMQFNPSSRGQFSFCAMVGEDHLHATDVRLAACGPRRTVGPLAAWAAHGHWPQLGFAACVH